MAKRLTSHPSPNGCQFQSGEMIRRMWGITKNLKQMKQTFLFILFVFLGLNVQANVIFIPMDDTQNNHLKAYGVTYWVLENGGEADWLINYRGGSFSYQYQKSFEEELIIRGVSYEVISDAEYSSIKEEINHPEANKDIVKLEKAPNIAVYSPKSKQPWDDAVTLVLTYAEIPYDVIYDDEIMNDELTEYDWLHLHHEDFTGQMGKFYAHYRHQPWYKEQQQELQDLAEKHGFNKISELKLAIVQRTREYVASGGFMFAMCSATETYDVALAAADVDICGPMFDGDEADQNAQQKLDFDNTLAFKDFNIEMNPYVYSYSNIDNQPEDRGLSEENDYFSLFTFSAKWDPIPTMLTQNHKKTIKSFMGQTTAFKKRLIKSDVVIMGENSAIDEAKYIHGVYGKGQWTFYGGHDPEDYQHYVGEEPTDLNLYPNSASYRLILNNILFPAAKKKKKKT